MVVVILLPDQLPVAKRACHVDLVVAILIQATPIAESLPSHQYPRHQVHLLDVSDRSNTSWPFRTMVPLKLTVATAMLLGGCGSASEQDTLEERLAQLLPRVSEAEAKFGLFWGGAPAATGEVVLVDGPLVAVRLDATSPRIDVDRVHVVSMALYRDDRYKGELYVLSTWREHALGVAFILTHGEQIDVGDRASVFTK